jgi:hypothetical protein
MFKNYQILPLQLSEMHDKCLRSLSNFLKAHHIMAAYWRQSLVGRGCTKVDPAL